MVVRCSLVAISPCPSAGFGYHPRSRVVGVGTLLSLVLPVVGLAGCESVIPGTGRYGAALVRIMAGALFPPPFVLRALPGLDARRYSY
jgi:hypothetical protein